MKLSQAHWKGKEGFREGGLKRLKERGKVRRGGPQGPLHTLPVSPQLLTPLARLSFVLSCAVSEACTLFLLSVPHSETFAADSFGSGGRHHSQGSSGQGQGKRAALASLLHHSISPQGLPFYILSGMWLLLKLTGHPLPPLLKLQGLQDPGWRGDSAGKGNCH